jgi:benzylsuccinate CoA-transferase BbsF subunit
VRAWTAGQDRWKLAERLQSAGIAAAPVEHLRDMIERDPQLAHRRHYQRVRQPSEPDVGITIDADAFRIAGVDPVLRRAPMMGEHNEPVLRDLLGVSEAEFDSLVVSGVIN